MRKRSLGARRGATNRYGFIDAGGSFTTIDMPGATATIATDINDSGQVAGIYYDSQGTPHGFIDTGGSFTSIDVSNASATEPFGIDNAGQMVGFFADPTGNEGFIVNGGAFTIIDVTDPPGALSVAATPLDAVPEPTSFVLLGTGLIGVVALRRKSVRNKLGRRSDLSGYGPRKALSKRSSVLTVT